MSTAQRRPSPVLAVLGAAALIVAAALSAPAASADSRPTNPNDPKTPTTVTADALPTVQIDGVVWTQVVVGNTVYVGGNFTSARPPGVQRGTSETPRSNLLAYDIRTGALKTDFAPAVNGQVLTMAASPDGSRLYIGGQFSTVAGETRSRVAAFNTSNGSLIGSFRPTTNSTVRALVATSSTVYIGGDLNVVSNVLRPRVAAVRASDGGLLPWNPAPDAPVTALTMTPDGTGVVLGGRFQNVAGAAAYGMAAVDATSGSIRPWLANQVVRNAGPDASITSLSTDGDSVYGTGYTFGAGGNFEGAFRARPSDGSLIWLEDCHGDSYSSFSRNDGAVYVAGHPHHCGNIGGFPETNPRSWRFAVAFSKAATGVVGRNTIGGYANFAGQPAPTLQTWFPELGIGTFTRQSQAAWHVTGNADYIVMGGEFPTVNGQIQQGLVRMTKAAGAPNKVGPTLNSDLQPTLSASGTSVEASWRAAADLDNRTLTYRLFRNGTVVRTISGDSDYWNRPTLRTTDQGLARNTTYRYKVSASDAFGNTVTSPEVSITTRSL